MGGGPLLLYFQEKSPGGFPGQFFTLICFFRRSRSLGGLSGVLPRVLLRAPFTSLSKGKGGSTSKVSLFWALQSPTCKKRCPQKMPENGVLHGITISWPFYKEGKEFSQRIWNTNLNKYGMRTPTFMPYEPFYWGWEWSSVH